MFMVLSSGKVEFPATCLPRYEGLVPPCGKPSCGEDPAVVRTTRLRSIGIDGALIIDEHGTMTVLIVPQYDMPFG